MAQEIRYNIIAEYEKQVNYPNHELCHESCRWVYLFLNKSSGFYKIGVTNRANERRRQITNTSGVMIENIISLQLQPCYDESPIFIEKWLHKHFEHKRVIGEWFYLNIKDVILIRTLFWRIEGEMIIDDFKEVLSKK